MNGSVYALPLLLLLTLPSLLPAQRCDVRRELAGELEAADLGGVLITARAGSLEVAPTDGNTITVRGLVCASDEELARDARLVVERRRDAAWVEADLPDRNGWGNHYVRMDMVVNIPRRMAADIDDGSGEITVHGIAAVRIEDGSGEMDVWDIEGAVVIDDGSGGIRVRNVGSVALEDGSGEIEIEDVRGDVRIIEDGSGQIDIRRVAGDVRIDEDGSGSIWVEGVGGDLVVRDDGSGSIRYRDVQGHVDLPDRR